MESIVYNEDCMIGMARYPDKYFDLAIVDPPYGIGASRATGTYARAATNYSKETDKGWDKSPPEKKYFDELRRVSVNQIIWGANYMTDNIPPSKGWVVWYKTDELKGRDFSEVELAFTSFDCVARHFEYRPFIRGGARIHPTQKPIALYDWLIQHYAKDCKNILDTHVGSGSSRIAAHKHGKDFIGFEIDKRYWEAQEKRYQQFIAQGTLF